jgi:hypothetical protein
MVCRKVEGFRNERPSRPLCAIRVHALCALADGDRCSRAAAMATIEDGEGGDGGVERSTKSQMGVEDAEQQGDEIRG